MVRMRFLASSSAAAAILAAIPFVVTACSRSSELEPSVTATAIPVVIDVYATAVTPYPTRPPYPEGIDAEPALLDLPDVCSDGVVYHSKLLAADLCVASGWTVATPEPDPSEILSEDKRPPGYSVGILVERKAGERVLASFGITVIGNEPTAVTRCSSPAVTHGVRFCVYQDQPGKFSGVPGATYRLLGMKYAGRWAGAEIFRSDDTGLLLALQREALSMLASLKFEP